MTTFNQKQKFGIKLIEDLISITCSKMIKIKQKERLNLVQVKDIVDIITKYQLNIIQNNIIKWWIIDKLKKWSICIKFLILLDKIINFYQNVSC